MPRSVDLSLAASVQFMRANLPPHAPGRDDLRGQITRIMAILPPFADADVAWVEAELRRREAVVARGDALLRGPLHHGWAWVRPARKAKWLLSGRNLTWRRSEGLPDAVARELDAGTDAVLSALADPRAPGPWARRALLVGPPQSGKGLHADLLLSKAADAGFPLLLVLTGPQDPQRAHTQDRLDAALLGHEARPDGQVGPERGAGAFDRDPRLRLNAATHRGDDGGFGPAARRSLSVLPGQRPWLFVVKRTPSALSGLLRWARDHLADELRGPPRRVTQLPLFVVDEAPFGAAGLPVDEEAHAERILGELLSTFDRSACVRYARTPGPGPADLVSLLRPASTYVGPTDLFGRLPLTRPAALRLRAGLGAGDAADPAAVEGLPPALAQAFDLAWLGFGAKAAADGGAPPAALPAALWVHAPGAPTEQEAVVAQIEAHVDQLRARLRPGGDPAPLRARLEARWRADLAPTAEALGAAPPPFEAAWAALPAALEAVQVRVIDQAGHALLEPAPGPRVLVSGAPPPAGLPLKGLTVAVFIDPPVGEGLAAGPAAALRALLAPLCGHRGADLPLLRVVAPEALLARFAALAAEDAAALAEVERLAAAGAGPGAVGGG